MFLGLPDPHPGPLVTSTDPDPSLFSCVDSVEGIEINNGCKIRLNTYKICLATNLTYHQTYFYNFEAFKFHLLKHNEQYTFELWRCKKSKVSYSTGKYRYRAENSTRNHKTKGAVDHTVYYLHYCGKQLERITRTRHGQLEQYIR
jgi:hypothetical protein